tara:strand:+ start:122 stop:1219 length:1098 start_codon:yes stop_codon:yes gene_type:complete
MNYDKEFLGRNGFIWFNGVVEDRIDPEYLGRVKVRCIGFHTASKIDLPTADLPWSMVVLPVTSAGISGVGFSPAALVEGSWVYGYFRDGENCQEPMVMGSIPGYPLELADSSKGFNDPNGVYPKYKNEVDTNRLAVNLKEDGNEINPHLSLTLRRSTRITGIATADFNPVTAADGSAISASDGDTFDQPEIPYSAAYPYNKVLETESGHIKEYDDTSGNERIHERHRTGTSYEIDKDGNKVEIIKGQSFRLLSNKEQVAISGDSDITIDGRHKIYINKSNTSGNNYDIQVGTGANVNIQVDSGDVNLVTVQGKINVNSGGDYNVKVGGNYNMTVAGSRSVTVEGTTTDNTTGSVTHRGSRIDLNP